MSRPTFVLRKCMKCSRIEENIYCLPGATSSNIFYLNCGRKGLIDTGHPGEIAKNLSVLKETGFSPEKLDFIINTHSHADHVGANSCLKHLNGDLQIIGSKRTAEYQACRKSTALFDDMEDDFSEYAVDWEVEDNEVVDIGGCQLKIIETPGHSRDSISVYVQDKRILFCGDTVCNKAVTQADYYQPLDASLLELLETYRKLKRCNAGIIYTGHAGPIRNIHASLDFCLKKLPRFMKNPRLALINNAVPLAEIYIFKNSGCSMKKIKEVLFVNLREYVRQFVPGIYPDQLAKIVDETYELMKMLRIFKVEGEQLYLANRLFGYIAEKKTDLNNEQV